MAVLEIYVEILTNFFEILHPPLYCEVYKNTYFENHLRTAASENQHLSDKFPEGG